MGIQSQNNYKILTSKDFNKIHNVFILSQRNSSKKVKAQAFLPCLTSLIRSNKLFNKQETIEKNKTKIQQNYTNRMCHNPWLIYKYP